MFISQITLTFNKDKSLSITWPIMSCILVMMLAIQLSFSNQEHVSVFKIFVTLLRCNAFLIFSKLSIGLLKFMQSLALWLSLRVSGWHIENFKKYIVKIFLVQIFRAWEFCNFQWCTMLHQGHRWRFLTLPSFYSDTYMIPKVRIGFSDVGEFMTVTDFRWQHPAPTSM